MEYKEIKIKLFKSPSHYDPRIRATVQSLGLRKLNQVKTHKFTPQIEGMIKKVSFLVTIVEEK